MNCQNDNNTPFCYRCGVNEFIELNWNIRNTKSAKVTLFVRIVPTQTDFQSEIINAESSTSDALKVADNVVIAGVSEFTLRLEPLQTNTIKMNVLISSVSKVQFLCLCEEVGVVMHETVISKGKYDVPTLILGNLEKVLHIFVFSLLVPLVKCYHQRY